jgi:hypothetical protein
MAVDRRALARAYKETPRTMGVGAVRNTVNGRALLVSGPDLPSLLNRHQAQLRLGAHPNRALRDDWAAHGPAAFVFEVLDTLKPRDDPDDDPTNDLRALEAMWIEKLGAWEPAGYHRRPRSMPS